MHTTALDMPEPLRTGTVVRLMGWPWMVALIGLFVATALAALVMAVAPAAREEMPGALLLSPWMVVGIALASALLALLAGPRALARILDEEVPVGMDPAAAILDQDLVTTLQAVSQGEKTRAHEASAALAGVVNLGVQMTGLVREVERRLQALPDHAPPQPSMVGPDPTALADAVGRQLSAAERRLAEAIGATGAGLEAKVLRLDGLADRLEAGARFDTPARMDTLVSRMERWLPAQENAALALTEGLAGQLGRVEDMLGKADRAATEAQAALADCSQHLEPGIAAIRQLPQLLARAETALDDRPLRETTQALDRVQAELAQTSQTLDATGGSLARCAESLAEGTGQAQLDAVAELAGLRAAIGDLTEQLQAARPALALVPAKGGRTSAGS